MAWATISTIAAMLMSLMAVQQTNAADTVCSNPSQGIRMMFRGVDITKLDLMPLDRHADNGIRNQIVKFTCNEGGMWEAPIGDRYEDPDQSWDHMSLAKGSLTTTVRVYKTSDDVQKSLAISAGVEGIIKGVAFSASASYKQMSNTLTQSDRYVQEVSAYDSSSLFQLKPSYVLPIDPHAQTYIDSYLKYQTFEWNKKPFEEFIKMFGTHYFREGKFGGVIKSIQTTLKSVADKKNEKEFEAEISANFWGLLKVQGSVRLSKVEVSKEVKENTITRVRYYGGNANLMAEDGVEAWQESVEKDPWLLQGKLEPITELIRDPHVKIQMEKAVNEYVLRVFVKELYGDVVRARIHERSAILDEYQDKIEKMLQKNVLDMTEVDDLNPPEWFTRHTQLCYQWKADGDINQCSGSSGKAYCALPNSWTREYVDDTKAVNGGCKMQWSLSAINNADWFKQVNLCYRYDPQGDWGQCGGWGGTKREVCAPLNTFTPEYKDATNGRSGGCKMSWKLQVPATAPFWLRTTRLCIKYAPTRNGHAAQCNHGPGQLCAESNKWTPYYLDDTDGRSGGCSMRWGLKVGVLNMN